MSRSISQTHQLPRFLTGAVLSAVFATPAVADAAPITFDLQRETPPMMFASGVGRFNPVLNVKLAGGTLPETVDAIDALWKTAGEPRPIRRQFVDQFVRHQIIGIETRDPKPSVTTRRRSISAEPTADRGVG